MSQEPKKSEKPADYRKAVAKQRRLKKIRQMKIKDRAGDMDASDISDVEVTGDVDEESQDSWLNDLLGHGDVIEIGDPTHSSGVESPPSLDIPEPEHTHTPKPCYFSSLNAATTIGVGIVTIVLTLYARLRK